MGKENTRLPKIKHFELYNIISCFNKILLKWKALGKEKDEKQIIQGMCLFSPSPLCGCWGFLKVAPIFGYTLTLYGGRLGDFSLPIQEGVTDYTPFWPGKKVLNTFLSEKWDEGLVY